MKKLAVLVLGLFFLSTANVFAAGKYGYVDLSYVFDNYYKTKDYDKVLEEQHQSFEEQRNDKIEMIREKQGQLGIMADDRKFQMEQEIDGLKQSLLEYDRQQKTDLTKKRNEKIREILLEIERIVSDYAEQNGYDLILNDRVLIYAAETLNITEEILNVLNSK